MLPEFGPFELVLRLLRQFVEDVSFWVENSRTALFRTGHTLHGVDLVDTIGIEAADAKRMLAVSDTVHLVLLVGFFTELALRAKDGVAHQEIGDANPVAGLLIFRLTFPEEGDSNGSRHFLGLPLWHGVLLVR